MFALPPLTSRDPQPELMDDPALDADEHASALRALRRMHFLTGTTACLWKPIRNVFGRTGARRLSVLDVGCGDASLLLKLHRRAKQSGFELELAGCDFSRRALDVARADSKAQAVPIQLHEIDITSDPLPDGFDVVFCTMFLHHFSTADGIEILRKLSESARRLMLVDDLLRTRLGYVLCGLGVQMISRCRVVHIDGPLSVRAAYSQAEIKLLFEEAGMADAVIRRHWPERFLAQWSPE